MPRLSIQLTPAELLYLGSVMGVADIVGLPDPHAGWFTEEVEAAFHEAVLSLQARGLLRVEPSLQVSRPLSHLLKPIFAPASVIVVSELDYAGHPLGGGLVYYWGQSHGSRVSLLPGLQYHIELLDTADDVAVSVRDRLTPCPADPVSGPPFSMPEDLLIAVRSQVSRGGVRPAVAALTALGADASMAEAIVAVLVRPVQNLVLNCLLRTSETSWTSQALAVLAGKEGNWKLRSFEQGDRPWIEFVPVAGTAFQTEVEALLRQVLTDA